MIQSIKRQVGEVGQGCHKARDPTLMEIKNSQRNPLVVTYIWIGKEVIDFFSPLQILGTKSRPWG